MAENVMKCNFCGKTENEVKSMFSAPEASICDECIRYCYNKIMESKEKSKAKMIEKFKKCSFCEKPENRVGCMFSSGKYNICDECVIYCYEMALKEDDNKNKSDIKVGGTDGREF